MSVLFRGKNEKWHLWWRRLHGDRVKARCSSAHRQLSFPSYGDRCVIMFLSHSLCENNQLPSEWELSSGVTVTTTAEWWCASKARASRGGSEGPCPAKGALQGSGASPALQWICSNAGVFSSGMKIPSGPAWWSVRFPGQLNLLTISCPGSFQNTLLPPLVEHPLAQLSPFPLRCPHEQCLLQPVLSLVVDISFHHTHSDKGQCWNPRALPCPRYPHRQRIPRVYRAGEGGSSQSHTVLYVADIVKSSESFSIHEKCKHIHTQITLSIGPEVICSHVGGECLQMIEMRPT